jgi:hypothetical protein
VTECQGCGAWNDASRTLCVLCGTPLAEIDEWDAAAELPPLPPLPDGGLAASMPAWLREPTSLAPPPGATAAASNDLAPLGARADPRTFLTDDDFPRWLRDLAARTTQIPPLAPTLTSERSAPLSWSDWPEAMTEPFAAMALTAAPVEEAPAASAPQSSALPLPDADDRPAAAVVTPRALEERRERGPWETLLLVLLFIGVVVAALWALVSNGVFSPGM